MANVLPTEEGMLVSGITGTMYSSYLGCCANQINLASFSTPDTRPRYQTCGAHPCTNLAQEDDLSCCALLLKAVLLVSPLGSPLGSKLG